MLLIEVLIVTLGINHSRSVNVYERQLFDGHQSLYNAKKPVY